MNKIKNKKTFIGLTIILTLILLVIIVISINMGSAKLNLYTKGSDPFVYNAIIYNIRLPRILLAGIVGMGLSVCGAIYQCILKNKMADPYILGVSSGAALGATIAIITKSFISIKLLAFLTAILITVLVYIISKKGMKKNSTSLILTGININYFLTAIISLLMILNKDQMDKIIFWTMGSFASSTWINVIWSAIIVIPSTIIVSFFGKQLNAINLDEKTAKSVGVDVELIRKIMIAICCLITAMCVSSSGIIGFIGLMIPHFVRLVLGGDYRYLITLSGITGAIFLIASDLIARTIITPTEIPIGIITAIIGAPYLIYLIARKR